MENELRVEQVIKLFIGYFNRAPAPGGTNYWAGRFEASSEGPAMTWAEIAESFSVQTETTTLYPIMDTRDFSKASVQNFLNSVFQNLFGRDIRDGGLTYYSEQLEGGTPVGEIILDIINGATSGPDKERIDNKVAVSTDFFRKTDAIEGFVFDDEARAVATDLLTTVTSDSATVAPAQAKTTAFVATRDDGTPGSTINLTANTDLPGGDGGGTDTQGTANNDTYSGTFESGGTGTLQNSDNIAAGDGIDTLNIRVVSASGETVAPSATGLEKVVVTSQTSGNSFVLNMAAMEGETELTGRDIAVSSTVVFTTVDAGVTTRMENVDGIVGVNFKGDASSSTDDAFTLFVQDSGTENTSAVFGTTNSSGNAFDDNYEIANIETGGNDASFLNIGISSLLTLNVSGSAKLHIESSNTDFAGLKTADASSMTGGGIFLDAEDNTQSDFSFTGSGFDDMVQLNNSLFNNNNTLSLDGGAGTDKLTVGNFSNLSAASVNSANGFEILESSDSSTSLEADDFSKIDIFSFEGQSGNDTRLNIRGVTSDDKFIFASDIGRGDDAVRFTADTAGQSLTFELAAESETGGEITILSDTNSNNSSAVGFGNSNINSVEIVSSGSNTNANMIRGIDNNNGNHFAFDNENGPNTFTASGAQDLTITAQAGVALTASDDERGFSSGVSFDASNMTGDLRIAASASADAIQGGSGADIIYGLGGNDVLTGNGGNDQFRLSDWSGTDTIKDFTSGQDKIGLQEVDFQNTTASSTGQTLASADYVENLQNIGSMSNSENQTLVELQLAASQSQIESSTAETSDAYLLVFNSTSNEAELWYDANWNTTSGREHAATIEGIDSVSDLVGLSRTDFVEYTF